MNSLNEERQQEQGSMRRKLKGSLSSVFRRRTPAEDTAPDAAGGNLHTAVSAPSPRWTRNIWRRSEPVPAVEHHAAALGPPRPVPGHSEQARLLDLALASAVEGTGGPTHPGRSALVPSRSMRWPEAPPPHAEADRSYHGVHTSAGSPVKIGSEDAGSLSTSAEERLRAVSQDDDLASKLIEQVALQAERAMHMSKSAAVASGYLHVDIDRDFQDFVASARGPGPGRGQAKFSDGSAPSALMSPDPAAAYGPRDRVDDPSLVHEGLPVRHDGWGYVSDRVDDEGAFPIEEEEDEDEHDTSVFHRRM